VKKVVTARATGDVKAELLEKGDGKTNAAIVRLWNVNPAVALAIQLENGKCAILPGLRGYIGHALFDEEGMTSVSYVPSSNHFRWGWYQRRKGEIDRLRALVSLAIDHGTFTIRSEREAASLASIIRVEKAVDPSLGLYAAHAFSQAGQDKEVLSVLRYMRGDLGVDLFDVKLLASRMLRDEKGYLPPQVPFLPMLTQTWNLLRPRGVDVPPLLEESRAYLCDSLWTTFQPKAADKIMRAIKNEELL
jgi:hypothetical protein